MSVAITVQDRDDARFHLLPAEVGVLEGKLVGICVKIWLYNVVSL